MPGPAKATSCTEVSFGCGAQSVLLAWNIQPDCPRSWWQQLDFLRPLLQVSLLWAGKHRFGNE